MFNISLTAQELELIGAALMEIPYKLAAPLIANINEQISQQEEADQPTSSSDDR